MARIPVGNFGQVAQAPALTQGTAPGGQDFVGRAVEQLGNAGQDAINQHLFEQRRAEEKAAAEAKLAAENLGRADDANKQLRYEVQVKSATFDLQGQIQRGEVPYQDFGSAYTSAINKIEVPKPSAVSPDHVVNFGTNLERIKAENRFDISKTALTAQDNALKSQFGLALDSLGKLAGMPGADVATINARAGAAAHTLGRQAGLSEAQVSKTLQDFKDNNWTQQATQRAMFARNDVGALDQVAADLTDAKGFYADKLDANKRNAILSQVTNRRQALQDRADHQQDRADAKGERAIGQMDAQIASGVPMTPELMAGWSDATKGTASAQDFQDRLQSYNTVQKVLRLPDDQQQAYLQQAQAKLQNQGGSVHEKSILDATTRAVEANIKQRTTDPLLWNQARMGDAVEPLDVASLADNAQSGQLAQQLQHRAATLDAMRKQYGSQIPMTLLLPQEAKALQTTLSQGTPKQQVELFGMMRQAAGDDAIYSAVMRQIAPDSTVRNDAGKFYLRQRSLMAGNGPLSPDSTNSQYGDIALKLLQGEQLLHPTSADAKQDGKRVAFPMPDNNVLVAQISETVGDAFNGRDQEFQGAIQSVRAYYAASTNEKGILNSELDEDVLKNAISAVIGEPATIHGRSVIPPWGTDSNTFEDRADTYISARLTAAQLPDPGGVSLMNVVGHDDYFVLVRGRQYVTGKGGQPMVIQIKGSAP